MQNLRFMQPLVIPLIILFAGIQQSFAQIANIESKRMQTDSVRFVLKESLSGSFNSTNGDYIYQLRNSLATQLKSKDLKKIYFLVSNYSLIRSANLDYWNTWFGHLRYNQQISELFRIEAFAQAEYNELLEVRRRNLLGGGLRFKLVDTDNIHVYLGNSYMYEIETAAEIDYYNHRNSSYISFSISSKDKKLELINTSYFQPLYSDITDYKLLEQAKFDIKLSNKLSMFMLYNYYLNSRTPSDIRQYISNGNIGISLHL